MSRKKKSLIAATAACSLLTAAFSLLFLCDKPGYPYDISDSTKKIRYIGAAMHEYHQKHGQLPPAVTYDRNGKPLYSWRLLLLPYLSDEGFYGRFKLDEPWDSPHNKELLKETPFPFQDRDEPGWTCFQVLVGPGTAFERPGLTFDDFPDGLGDTLLVVEAKEPVPWSKPADVVYDPNAPLPALGGRHVRRQYYRCFQISQKPGFTAGFADASSGFILTENSEPILRALITRNGGEKLGREDLK